MGNLGHSALATGPGSARAYLRSRSRLVAVAGLWLGLLLTASGILAWRDNLASEGVRNDFRLYYGVAHLGRQAGWAQLYDLAAQKRTLEGLGFYWSPYLNPPPLAWLAVPFTSMPFGLALAVWSLLLLAGMGTAWWLLAPGAGIGRYAHLALALGWLPLSFSLAIGQPVGLAAAAVAGSWRLLRNQRPALAGLCLSVVILKPQLGLLVPVTLFASGRIRAGAVSAACLGLAALASALTLGFGGIDLYRSALATASQWELTRQFALAGHVDGLPRALLQVGIVAGSAAIAWRRRRSGPEIPMAAGLAGSVLVTPYTGYQDLAMLVLAAWLVLRWGAPAWMTLLLVGGFVAGELALATGPVPLWICEACFWAALWLLPETAPKPIEGAAV